MTEIFEIIELILIPFILLLILGYFEQWIEPIAFDDRTIKTIWDTEIFCLGAQGGLTFRAAVGHPNGFTGWAILCFLFLVIGTIVIGIIRKRELHKGDDPTQNPYQNTAFCLGSVSIVIPPLYVITSS